MNRCFYEILRIAFVICLFVPALHAQPDPGRVHHSPYSVVYNHLYHLQPDSWNPEQSAASFHADPQRARTLAIQLKEVLDGKGIFVDLDRLPTRHNYLDSVSGEAICFLLGDQPLIYVERIDTGWYYSKTTMEAIPSLHREVFPLGTGIASWFQGAGWQVAILDIALWKWLGILALLALTIVAYRIFHFIIHRWISPVLRRRLQLADDLNEPVRKFSRLVGLWLGVQLFCFLLPMLLLPVRTNALLMKTLYVLGMFFVIFIINLVVRILFSRLRRVTQNSESALDDQFIPVLRRLAYILVWVLGIFHILNFLGVDITALLAGISIGGLAIALAAQDTVKNFFGSIMIFVDKPFQIGDAIQFDGITGVVEEVGIRSTRIRTLTNSLTAVPNAILADKVVDNLGLRIYRLYRTEIGITYDTPPTLVDLFIRGVRTIIQEHPLTRKDFIEVHLYDFAASALNIRLHTFFEVPDYTTELKSRHEVMQAILMLAEALGVRFAFPTQTLHVETIPGTGSLTPKPLADAEAEKALEESLKRISRYFTEKTNRTVA